jgi:hypothetical protein
MAAAARTKTSLKGVIDIDTRIARRAQPRSIPPLDILRAGPSSKALN